MPGFLHGGGDQPCDLGGFRTRRIDPLGLIRGLCPQLRRHRRHSGGSELEEGTPVVGTLCSSGSVCASSRRACEWVETISKYVSTRARPYSSGSASASSRAPIGLDPESFRSLTRGARQPGGCYDLTSPTTVRWGSHEEMESARSSFSQRAVRHETAEENAQAFRLSASTSSRAIRRGLPD